MPTIADIRDWIAEHMPSLAQETRGLRDPLLRVRLCEHIGVDEETDNRILWRKLKQHHFGD